MKKIMLVTIVIFVLLLFSIMLVVLSNKKSSPNISSQIPTPTPISPESIKTTPLRVISTNPSDGATQLSSLQSFTISFNNTVTTKDIIIASFPPIQFSQTIQGKNLVLTPQQEYENNILYTLTLESAQTRQALTTIHFSSGTSPTAIPMQDTNIQQDVDTYDKVHDPDVFLTNQLPYSTKDFSVTSYFVESNPYGHYAFTVVQNDNTGKQNFLSWLKSLGLSDSQIQNLDISYQ